MRRLRPAPAESAVSAVKFVVTPSQLSGWGVGGAGDYAAHLVAVDYETEVTASQDSGDDGAGGDENDADDGEDVLREPGDAVGVVEARHRIGHRHRERWHEHLADDEHESPHFDVAADFVHRGAEVQG